MTPFLFVHDRHTSQSYPFSCDGPKSGANNAQGENKQYTAASMVPTIPNINTNVPLKLVNMGWGLKN